jgi:hypothetical protein
MRHIAGLLMIVASVMHLLLGGGSLVSWKYEEIKARTEAGDLSDVAGDLVDDKTLARERAAGAERADTSAATRKMVFGFALLALALGQFACAILLFLGRRRSVVLGVLAVSIPVNGVWLFVERISVIGLIGLGTLVLALVLVLVKARPA